MEKIEDSKGEVSEVVMLESRPLSVARPGTSGVRGCTLLTAIDIAAE